MEQIEGNRKIAMYMGAVYKELNLFMQPNAGYIWEYPEGEYPSDNTDPWAWTMESLKYHNDWNWLMVATEKVSIEIDVEWNKRGLQHIGLEEAQRDITDALLGMQIEPVWEAVVKGIQVLNKLKEDEKETN